MHRIRRSVVPLHHRVHPFLVMLAGVLASAGVIYATRNALASVYRVAAEGGPPGGGNMGGGGPPSGGMGGGMGGGNMGGGPPGGGMMGGGNMGGGPPGGGNMGGGNMNPSMGMPNGGSGMMGGDMGGGKMGGPGMGMPNGGPPGGGNMGNPNMGMPNGGPGISGTNGMQGGMNNNGMMPGGMPGGSGMNPGGPAGFSPGSNGNSLPGLRDFVDRMRGEGSGAGTGMPGQAPGSSPNQGRDQGMMQGGMNNNQQMNQEMMQKFGQGNNQPGNNQQQMPPNQGQAPNQGQMPGGQNGMGDQGRNMMNDQGRGMINDQGRGMMNKGMQGNDQGMKQGNGQGQGMMQGGMQGGMTEEQQQKMQDEQQKQQDEREKKQEEQRKALEARGLVSMKQGMKQAANGLASMKKIFDKAVAKGATLPTDCADTLAKAQAVIDGVAKAETMEDAQNAGPEDLGEYFQTLNECRQTMEQITRARPMLKRADTDIRSLERRWAKAKRSPTAEMADLITEGDGIVASIKEKRATLDGFLKDGNMDDFQATIEDDIYGRFDDVDTVIRHLDATRNAKRFLTEYGRRLQQAKSTIAKLQRNKQDTTKLEDILARAQAQYATLKTLKAGSDEFDAALQDAFALDQEFSGEFSGDQQQNIGAQLQGSGSSQDNFQLNLPDSLK